MNWIIVALVAIVCFVLGLWLARSQGPAPIDVDAVRKAAEAEAEQLKKRALLEGQAAADAARAEIDQQARARKDELMRREEALAAKERELEKQRRDQDRRKTDLEAKERSAEGRAKQVEAAVTKAEAAQLEAKRKLEEIAGLTAAEAELRLREEVKASAMASVAREVAAIETEAKQQADAKAKGIIAATIQRYASEFVGERTVSVVPLPSDDLKGRLIGREGRNIRALEAATGIDIIIDDSTESLTISCFNPVRREIARLAIGALVADGRIHPTRIEEVVRKAEKDIDKVCKEAGEQAVFDLGLHRVHPELVRLLGRLKFRQSMAHNVLAHSVEVGYLAGLMAAELGQNVKLARRAGLLHDIGKAMDHEHEGAHAEAGATVARKHGESPKVCQAIAAHHGHVDARSVLDHVVAAANALSSARPGARREQLASYIKRLEDLETLCQKQRGVEKAYALQAGREVHVMVHNDQVDDAGALLLSKELAHTIEQSTAYAGSVRVVVVRETRASEYAR